jgi:hypothetical protein
MLSLPTLTTPKLYKPTLFSPMYEVPKSNAETLPNVQQAHRADRCTSKEAWQIANAPYEQRFYRPYGSTWSETRIWEPR